MIQGAADCDVRFMPPTDGLDEPAVMRFRGECGWSSSTPIRASRSARARRSSWWGDGLRRQRGEQDEDLFVLVLAGEFRSAFLVAEEEVADVRAPVAHRGSRGKTESHCREGLSVAAAAGGRFLVVAGLPARFVESVVVAVVGARGRLKCGRHLVVRSPDGASSRYAALRQEVARRSGYSGTGRSRSTNG